MRLSPKSIYNHAIDLAILERGLLVIEQICLLHYKHKVFKVYLFSVVFIEPVTNFEHESDLVDIDLKFEFLGNFLKVFLRNGAIVVVIVHLESLS